MTPEELIEEEAPEVSEPTEDVVDQAITDVVAVTEEEESEGEDVSEETTQAEPDEVASEEPEEVTEAESSAETAEEVVVEPEVKAGSDEVAAEEPETEITSGKVPWWPFVAYAILWAAVAGAAFFLLGGAEAAIPAFRHEVYPYVLLGGLLMTLLGPLLAVFVWFLAWKKADIGNRGGLFTQAMIRGAVVTFLGVAAWYGALNLVDAMRLGWI